MHDEQPQSGAPEPIRFQVEVQPGAEPISGNVRWGDALIPFVGWVGLASALEQVLARRAPVV
jgi:hypothetical protein